MAEDTKQEDVLQDIIQVFKNKTFLSRAPENRQKPTFFLLVFLNFSSFILFTRYYTESLLIWE